MQPGLYSEPWTNHSPAFALSRSNLIGQILPTKSNISFQIQVHGTYKMQLSGQDKVSESDFAAFSIMDTLVVVDIKWTEPN